MYGAIMEHLPHQLAMKSITTGLSDFSRASYSFLLLMIVSLVASSMVLSTSPAERKYSRDFSASGTMLLLPGFQLAGHTCGRSGNHTTLSGVFPLVSGLSVAVEQLASVSASAIWVLQCFTAYWMQQVVLKWFSVNSVMHEGHPEKTKIVSTPVVMSCMLMCQP